MKLEVKRNLGEKVESTTTGTKMRLSDDAASMVFQMFTNNIYSDPIGTVVREITSNSFDAHAELTKLNGKKVDAPVLIKLYQDMTSNNWYISFIDSGVGMSPDRIENIYGVYFESSKRDSNEEIGGFGIGGKTPLAYSKDGFFVITRFDGIEYMYNIIAGEEAPEIHLLSQSSTTKPNGTEVRIPLKSEWDRRKFADAINKQLHYFEDVYFEGFEDFYEVQNEYKLFKGKNFIYRKSEGKTYSNYMHVCVGKVAYPIDYDVIGLQSGDHQLPIALQFDIGELRPTASRETLDYKANEDTDYNPIKIILKKIEATKIELAEMLAKQHDNVRDIASYYEAKDNLFMLKLTPDVIINVSRIIKKEDIKFPNFPYNDLSIPSKDDIVGRFYDFKRQGKKEGRWDSEYKGDWERTKSNDNIYRVEGEFKRKVMKSAYLNSLHTRTYIVLPHNLDSEEVMTNYRDIFGLRVQTDAIHKKTGLRIFKEKVPKKTGNKLIKALHKEVVAYVNNNTIDYDKLVVPDDFIISRKKRRLPSEVLKTSIPVSADFYSTRCNTRIELQSLFDIKGKIFYANADRKQLLKEGRDLYIQTFGSKYLIKLNWGDIYYENDHKSGVMFIMTSKTNEKYFKMLDNAYPIDMFYPLMFHRKMKDIGKGKQAARYIDKWQSELVGSLYKRSDFKHINKDIHDHVEIVKAELKELDKYRSYDSLYIQSNLITQYVNLDSLEKEKVEFDSQKSFDYLVDVTERNKKKIKWIDLPYYDIDPTNGEYNELIEILQVVVDA